MSNLSLWHVPRYRGDALARRRALRHSRILDALSDRTWRPVIAMLIVGLASCAGQKPSVPLVSDTQARSADRTVFNDTALFRIKCSQADSGLTPKVGRCTPRDQRLKIH